MFQPKHTLRPSGGRRRFESSVKSIRAPGQQVASAGNIIQWHAWLRQVHISLAKVYDVLASMTVLHGAPVRGYGYGLCELSGAGPPALAAGSGSTAVCTSSAAGRCGEKQVGTSELQFCPLPNSSLEGVPGLQTFGAPVAGPGRVSS